MSADLCAFRCHYCQRWISVRPAHKPRSNRLEWARGARFIPHGPRAARCEGSGKPVLVVRGFDR